MVGNQFSTSLPQNLDDVMEFADHLSYDDVIERLTNIILMLPVMFDFKSSNLISLQNEHVLYFFFSMLEACKSTEEVTTISSKGQQLFQMLEDSKKPFVAAIMGSCLGGGLEVSFSEL